MKTMATTQSRHGTLAALTLLMAPAASRAGGFEVYEHGAAATGMVGAFTAKADDASTIFYNPAGLARLHEALHPYVGTTAFIGGPSASSTPDFTLPPGRSDGEVKFIPLPAVYVSYGLAPERRARDRRLHELRAEGRLAERLGWALPRHRRAPDHRHHQPDDRLAPPSMARHRRGAQRHARQRRAQEGGRPRRRGGAGGLSRQRRRRRRQRGRAAHDPAPRLGSPF